MSSPNAQRAVSPSAHAMTTRPRSDVDYKHAPARAPRAKRRKLRQDAPGNTVARIISVSPKRADGDYLARIIWQDGSETRQLISTLYNPRYELAASLVRETESGDDVIAAQQRKIGAQQRKIGNLNEQLADAFIARAELEGECEELRDEAKTARHFELDGLYVAKKAKDALVVEERKRWHFQGQARDYLVLIDEQKAEIDELKRLLEEEKKKTRSSIETERVLSMLQDEREGTAAAVEEAEAKCCFRARQLCPVHNVHDSLARSDAAPEPELLDAQARVRADTEVFVPETPPPSPPASPAAPPPQLPPVHRAPLLPRRLAFVARAPSFPADLPPLFPADFPPLPLAHRAHIAQSFLNDLGAHGLLEREGEDGDASEEF